jgi:hypothetical protein
VTKDIASLYCERIFDRFGYLAAWLPGADVKIGALLTDPWVDHAASLRPGSGGQ